jgi:hypothetical protein
VEAIVLIYKKRVRKNIVTRVGVPAWGLLKVNIPPALEALVMLPSFCSVIVIIFKVLPVSANKYNTVANIGIKFSSKAYQSLLRNNQFYGTITLTMYYGFFLSSEITESKTLQLNLSDLGKNEEEREPSFLVARFWAQRKIEQLLTLYGEDDVCELLLSLQINN